MNGTASTLHKDRGRLNRGLYSPKKWHETRTHDFCVVINFKTRQPSQYIFPVDNSDVSGKNGFNDIWNRWKFTPDWRVRVNILINDNKHNHKKLTLSRVIRFWFALSN